MADELSNLATEFEVDDVEAGAQAGDEGQEDADQDDKSDEDELAEEEDKSEGEDEDKSGEEGESEEDKDEDENDDYFTTAEEEEPPARPAASAPVEQPPAGTQVDAASKFILDGLSKIAVRIVVPGADGQDETKQVEVYGFGDLPRDIKGFASEYERGVFQAAVNAQEIKARELKNQWDTNQAQKQNEIFIERENKAIAEDLRELRQEGVFPKFKGTPGSKEFDESDGAKEFERVLAFMNERNDQYVKRANEGKNYRHIGFREAYELLNGPVEKAKAKDKAEDKARRDVARKTKSGKGAEAKLTPRAPRAVTSLTELADEFVMK